MLYHMCQHSHTHNQTHTPTHTYTPTNTPPQTPPPQTHPPTNTLTTPTHLVLQDVYEFSQRLHVSQLHKAGPQQVVQQLTKRLQQRPQRLSQRRGQRCCSHSLSAQGREQQRSREQTAVVGVLSCFWVRNKAMTSGLRHASNSRILDCHAARQGHVTAQPWVERSEGAPCRCLW